MSPVHTAPTVLIRAARGSDGEALDRLAQLDSAHVPAGDLLVAESDGSVVAALAPETGAAIADPFRPTADVLALLRLRGERLRGAAHRGRARRPAMRSRAA